MFMNYIKDLRDTKQIACRFANIIIRGMGETTTLEQLYEMNPEEIYMIPRFGKYNLIYLIDLFDSFGFSIDKYNEDLIWRAKRTQPHKKFINNWRYNR